MSRGSSSNERARLHWRCRRGMLELDVLLQNFLQRGYERLDPGERVWFERLLEYPDPLLIEYLMGRLVPTDGDAARVIDKIRHTAGH
ncbi:MAG: succinate dehydrogenase assembly factor 2 [Gammaproteobacteria bacterium]|nr:succinate dehydrogenase assembly factor 2 [Gammaproteobacteria bacterium]